MIKNIVFDIGNVLVRFQPDEAMREIGIEENKIAALAHATYENPVWVELDRGVIPENEIIDEMVKVAPQYEAIKCICYRIIQRTSSSFIRTVNLVLCHLLTAKSFQLWLG